MLFAYFFHCNLKIAEALVQGIEQGMSTIGLGGDDELTRSRLFHREDIAKFRE